MGVRGRRIVKNVNEPTLLGNIDIIIENAKKDGFINQNVVDIKSIIEQNGIKLKFEDMPSSKSGYLTRIDGLWIIGVNSNHHVHRQRYTMAHEFAHYCLHKSENNFFEDEVFYRDEVQTSIEYAANTFAANLLMPNFLIDESIKKGIASLKELASRFNVSPLAVKSRILNLGYKIVNDEE
jgi:Zn-dependent peptidase ImmA (M78 family)